ncbi:MAG: hypothetical protein V1880_02070 [Patescibacteria group bacterium]
MKRFTPAQNTKGEGILRFLVYFDPKDQEFVGVCMDLGIIKCGKNPKQVEQDVLEAAFGYVETVCKDNLPDKLLNQKPPKEYIDVFDNYISITDGSKKYTSLAKTKKQKEIDIASTNIFCRPIVDTCHAI